MAKNRNRLSIFQTVKSRVPGYNWFPLDHDRKFSFQMGRLVPSCVLECLPGDRYRINPQTMMRFAPLISPVMHRVHVSTHFFFVPTRLLWENWFEFLRGDDIEHPYFTLGSAIEKGSLMDYLGYPTGDPGSIQLSPMPIAAYQKIFTDWYFDQNMGTTANEPPFYENESLADGLNGQYATFYSNSFHPPYRRNWGHDYFTSALGEPQAGAAVEIPILAEQDINVTWEPTAASGQSAAKVVDGFTGANYTGDMTADGGDLESVGGAKLAIDPNGTQVVDFQGEAADINSLRRAFRLQEFLEKMARGGRRLTEILKTHFGEHNGDSRLQRAEYIGGTKSKMTISEVLATAQTDVASVEYPLGTMAGHGINFDSGNTFTYKTPEHGWIIGITSVLPDTAYQQGLPRSHTRQDRLDYAWPSFANIGEQEILKKEIYMESADPEGVFGYIPRYAEYKYQPSTVHGDFRDTLAFWHMGRIFSSEPQLNYQFNQADPTTRIFANETGDHIYAHVYNKIDASKKLPKFGVPTI